MPAFVVRTIGCKVNQYDSQRIVEQLEALGWRACANGDRADLCLVNTCTVTEEADAKCRQALRRLRRRYPDALVVAVGCYGERDRAVLESMPEVDRVLGNAGKERLVEVLGLGACSAAGISRFAGRTRAFLKAQDGCNQHCSYCIVPSVRGSSRSRPLGELVDEARRLVENGYPELVLTGIHLGDYGEGDHTLPDLVRALDGLDGLKRLRISSIDPKEVTPRLIETIATGRTTCPHLHVSIQSGSDAVLARMNRGYTRDEYLDMARRLTHAMADFVLTTDLLVGFPGETKAEFAKSLDVIEQVGFGKVHVFPFSPRPGTRAAARTDPVEPTVIRERVARALHSGEVAARRCRERFVSRVLDVLVEGPTRDPKHLHGFPPNYLKTVFPIGQTRSGELEAVRIESFDATHLYGKRVAQS